MDAEIGQLIQACGSAFAWVAFSDKKLTHLDVNCFVELLNESPYVDDLSGDDFEKIYLSRLEEFEEDYEKAVLNAKDKMKIFKDDPKMAREILKYAREAIFADKHIDKKELAVFEEIKEILGLKVIHYKLK